MLIGDIMRILDKAEKGVELGKTLTKYSYTKAKSLHDPEMRRMTRELGIKWARVGEQKADQAMDKVIEGISKWYGQVFSKKVRNQGRNAKCLG